MLVYKNERDNLLPNTLFFDANENFEQWVRLSTSVLTNLNRYPSDNGQRLGGQLAAYLGANITSDNIQFFAGSIDAINCILKIFGHRRVLVNAPTYDYYRAAAQSSGAEVVVVEMIDSSHLDIAKLLSFSSPDTLLVLISPNNPTGRLLHAEEVELLMSKFKGQIIIDEAYIEYAGLTFSYQKNVLDNSNIFILRTFSKAWGLAGIRMGYVISAKENINLLAKHVVPYSVNGLSQAIVREALNQADGLAKSVKRMMRLKAKFVRLIEDAGFKVYDTDCNFVLIELPNAPGIQQRLKNNRILCRARYIHWMQKDLLRVTVGSEVENYKFTQALKTQNELIAPALHKKPNMEALRNE